MQLQDLNFNFFLINQKIISGCHQAVKTPVFSPNLDKLFLFRTINEIAFACLKPSQSVPYCQLSICLIPRFPYKQNFIQKRFSPYKFRSDAILGPMDISKIYPVTLTSLLRKYGGLRVLGSCYLNSLRTWSRSEL